ncbi:hypothetical protein GCK32_003350 [Trichostrongylus colubriformis]|uniref:G protein-coupled receptor n=1 Tax=Trichostrongylus colubriformis TaxID=6319 RepID=A0AAN8ILR4_TRICO
MNCTGVLKDLITNRGFLAVIASQAFTGFFAGLIGAVVIKKCSNLYFHINCKILIGTTLSLSIIHSIIITSLQTLHFSRYILYPNPCEAAMSSALCLTFRLPANICGTAFAVLQIGMVIERAFALWKRREYEYYGCSLGIIITAFCVLFSAASTYWALGVMDLSLPTAYCSASTAQTAERLTMLFFFLCAVDVISLVGVALLHTFNASATKRKVFDLRSSYQLQENAAVIRLLLPLSIFDTICHFAFSTSSAIIQLFQASFTYVTYRTILASTYLLPYYGVVSPLLLWLIIRKSKQLRMAKLRAIGLRLTNEREVYFQGYNQMWRMVEAK